jgi:tetratricopeptide (TPR) repeat protein
MIGHSGMKRGDESNLRSGSSIPYRRSKCPRAVRFFVGTLSKALAVLSLASIAPFGQGAAEPGQTQATKPTAASPGSPSVDHKTEIQRYIADLGSGDFSAREKAASALWKAGAEAQPALEKVVRETDDFEVAYRAGQILQSFQLGIFADTPPGTLAMIGQFRMGNINVKQEIGRRLKEAGKTDLVRRLIAKEPSPDIRDQLNQFLFGTGSGGNTRAAYGSAVVRVGPRILAPGLNAARVMDAAERARRARLLLGRGAFDQAERYLQAGTEDASVRDYAALLLSHKSLDAAIIQLRANLQASDTATQRRLTWMLRAKGDLAGAIAAARLVKDDDLIEDLLAEKADWTELAKTGAKIDLDSLAAAPNGTTRLGRTMVFRHLAGEKQSSDVAATAVIKALKQGRFPQNLVISLILSDRMGPAIENCTPPNGQMAFELLVGQSRFKDAFQLVKIGFPIPVNFDWAAWLKDGKAQVPVERRLLAHHVVRTLRSAGEDTCADALIQALLAVMREKQAEENSEMYALLLMDVEVGVGRVEAIDGLAVKLLELGMEHPEQVISHIYRDQIPTAVSLWKAIRKESPGEERLAALKHLRRLLTGKPDPAAVEELRRFARRIETQLEAPASDPTPDDESADDPRARNLLVLAKLFHRYGQDKLMTQYLARIGKAVSAETLLEAGKLYDDAKQWDEAIKSYQAAWVKDRQNATAAYLMGWAQSQKGNHAEGRKQMELALAVPLADGESRRELARLLARLHQDDAAARQRELLLRLAAPHDRSVLMILMENGEIAEKAGTGAMATPWQRAVVELLAGRFFMSEARYYLQPAVSAHAARARELLRAGKTAAAIEELRQAEALQPGNLQLSLDCDSDLRKHGATSEADALYRRMLERHEAFCRDFPRSATFHNDLAWLSANLDRDLDKALAHSQRAVEIEPQSAGILDTLAEVHFRRGNRAEAVRLMKRCLDMDPDGEHYKRQLLRFETK